MSYDAPQSTLQTTPLHTWIGIVAATKATDSISIEVMIQELFPTLTGTVGSTPVNQTYSLNDINGNSINGSVTTKTTVTAYYYGNTSNRKYPPDVVAGEQVRVLKLANSDKYYWESMGRDDGLRLTERYRIEAKNRSGFADPTDDAHSYSIEMDSKVNKHVRILTSTGSGEQHTYVLLIDTANSKVQLSDEIGNAVTIDSNNAKVIVQNSKSAFMMLNGLDAVFAAPRDVTIKAGRQMLIDSPLITMSNTSGAGVLAISSKAIAISASTDFVLNSPAIGLTGAVKIPNILTVNNLRAATTAGTSVGAAYSPASISLSGGSGTVPGVSPDTTMPAGQRHAVAWENFSDAMEIIINCFNTIQNKIGVPTQQSTLIPVAMAAEMLNLTGV